MKTNDFDRNLLYIMLDNGNIISIMPDTNLIVEINKYLNIVLGYFYVDTSRSPRVFYAYPNKYNTELFEEKLNELPRNEAVVYFITHTEFQIPENIESMMKNR
jgi:hypothetical protein